MTEIEPVRSSKLTLALLAGELAEGDRVTARDAGERTVLAVERSGVVA